MVCRRRRHDFNCAAQRHTEVLHFSRLSLLCAPWGASIQPFCVHLEQLVNAFPQLPVLRGGQLIVLRQQLSRGGLRLVQQQHIAVEIGDLQHGQTVLPLAEEIAGTPELQILLRDLEAVVGVRQGLQSPLRLLAAALSHQHAVALGPAAAYAAPQLVQLAQTEALGVLHHHQRGVGHVHAHLHHRGGHQNVRLAGGKGRHDGFLLPDLHLAVQHRDPQIGEGLLLQGSGIGRHGLPLVGEVVAVAHQRTHDEYLMALGHLLTDEAVQPRPIPLVHGKGIHPLPSRRKLVDDGHIQIAVDDQRQRPGDGGGGQHQHMGILRLLAKRRPLGHAEAVLLVGDDQSQLLILHILCQQGVGADAKADAAVGESLQNDPPLLGFRRAGQQGTGDAEPGEQRRQIFIVLLCQYLRGSH